MLTGCEKNKPVLVESIAQMNVENVVSMDREAMFLNYGENYRWYETCVLLKDYFDEDSDGSFVMVTNVFQALLDKTETSCDTYVVKFQHIGDSTITESVHSFWVEDCPLETEVINLTYEQAFQRIQEVNYPKPHSKHCILRKPVGPKDCNPQWVFGNIRMQIWVDAVTGEVKDSNPAFEGYDFGTPLGEWP